MPAGRRRRRKNSSGQAAEQENRAIGAIVAAPLPGDGRTDCFQELIVRNLAILAILPALVLIVGCGNNTQIHSGSGDNVQTIDQKADTAVDTSVVPSKRR
jgi:hypothetical protein